MKFLAAFASFNSPKSSIWARLNSFFSSSYRSFRKLPKSFQQLMLSGRQRAWWCYSILYLIMNHAIFEIETFLPLAGVPSRGRARDTPSSGEKLIIELKISP